ncbi:hypothetical protein K491DRAFT_723070 [Lophiostoma macrostomum CBS 122681]|uniref:Uncharacterized protein n=1 Tax=Lophiostoma macrostomum CBS 122681 TaxID=1314788 RepID=A0A6A6SJV5_9PLEO|nr:hypothetical protein K491DRAFT_723070 [Lophiostoma macrostomum CBS 122681]
MSEQKFDANQAIDNLLSTLKSQIGFHHGTCINIIEANQKLLEDTMESLEMENRALIKRLCNDAEANKTELDRIETNYGNISKTLEEQKSHAVHQLNAKKAQSRSSLYLKVIELATSLAVKTPNIERYTGFYEEEKEIGKAEQKLVNDFEEEKRKQKKQKQVT